MSVEALDRPTSVRPRSGVVWREVDGQAVLLALPTGRYFTLNDTGTHLWRSLSGGATLGELETGLRAAYGDQPTVWQDLLACVTELLREELVELCPRDAAPTEPVRAGSAAAPRA